MSAIYMAALVITMSMTSTVQSIQPPDLSNAFGYILPGKACQTYFLAIDDISPMWSDQGYANPEFFLEAIHWDGNDTKPVRVDLPGYGFAVWEFPYPENTQSFQPAEFLYNGGNVMPLTDNHTLHCYKTALPIIFR